MFKAVGIITKLKDHKSDVIADKLNLFLEKKRIKVIKSTREKIAKYADLIVVIGGDGTLLNTARYFVDSNIPILAVNLGRLGFLADVNIKDMFVVLEQVFKNEYTKEKRILLSCQIEDNKKIINRHLALNDVVIHRNEVNLRMMEFDIFINDKFLSSQFADGLIITTPTGSTAYALSSGGPIIHPEIDAIGIVSICPHTISHRPLLIPGNNEIVIHIKESKEGAIVSFDGQTSFTVKAEQKISIRKYDNFINLLHPKNYDYFSIIRSKLHWNIKL
jgi:NAD+ kinase